ncbi:MAG TPA: PilZ domain-containing protein [Acidimicrobiales bacterium]|nr:PilZ domain-containing protein [Acidimicrobiales bacterium]
MAPAEVTGPLEAGVRVSLELPEAGTCVAVVASSGGTSLVLDLLDELPEGELEPGSTLDLFMPRSEGIYHWPCLLSSPPLGQRAEFELLDFPMFVQRRRRHRVEAELQAMVRRLHSTRRGRAHEMTVADLSHGGLKLEGPFQIGTGDTIEVSFDLGVAVQLVGRAVMAYPTPNGNWAAHVSFLDGQREAIDAVDNYVMVHLKGLP